MKCEDIHSCLYTCCSCRSVWHISYSTLCYNLECLFCVVCFQCCLSLSPSCVWVFCAVREDSSRVFSHLKVMKSLHIPHVQMKEREKKTYSVQYCQQELFLVSSQTSMDKSRNLQYSSLAIPILSTTDMGIQYTVCTGNWYMEQIYHPLWFSSMH